MKKIFIFGNPLLDIDSLPLKLASDLQKAFPDLEFEIIDPNENLKPVNQELIIIDTAINTDAVVILDDINKLETESSCSLHDFDLATNLKLLHKLGELKKVTIFCVPPGGNEKFILKNLIKTIKEYFGLQA